MLLMPAYLGNYSRIRSIRSSSRSLSANAAFLGMQVNWSGAFCSVLHLLGLRDLIDEPSLSSVVLLDLRRVKPELIVAFASRVMFSPSMPTIEVVES